MPAGKPESARGVGSLGSGRPSGGRGGSTSSGGNVRVVRPKDPITRGPNPFNTTKPKMPTAKLTPKNKPLKVSKAKEAKLLKEFNKPVKSFGAKSDRARKEKIQNSPYPNVRKRYEEVTRQFKLEDARRQAINSGKVKAMNKKGM